MSSNNQERLTKNEHLKKNSNYLRGTIKKELENPITGAIPEEDTILLKFHGSYQQDDRDLRNERRRQKLEPAYQFMIRARTAGGVTKPAQWLVMDELADKYANGTFKITTRQTYQLHGILKRDLKKTIKEMNEALITSIATCGDINRNVMCNVNPEQSEAHAEVYEYARKISDHLLPGTTAYHEIWLDDEKVAGSREDVEPIYGETYLPRKFKIGIAVPPSNDVDIYSQDIGFVAILEEGKLVGFNILVGGGMGMTHGDPATYPQISRSVGFIPAEKAVEVAEKIVTIQRDYGNRTNRKNARFKYTIDKYGLEWFKEELENRLQWKLEEERPFTFESNGDRYGWVKGKEKWYLTLFIQNGRVKDEADYLLRTGLREIAKVHKGDFRLTPNQNVIIANIVPEDKEQINELVKKYDLLDGEKQSGLRRNSIACVAFPTCGLAMAESERYLPELIDKIEDILAEVDLLNEEIVIRMSGCPNGCSRAALAEIGFIGKGPGKYNLYLGGAFNGTRLNKLYRENIGEEEILNTLRPILHQYAEERNEKERFGDFVIRKGIVEEVRSGLDFHAENKVKN